jgi:hypothetical protein
MSRSPAQGILPTVLDLVTEVKRKVSWRRPKPKLGCTPKRKKTAECYVWHAYLIGIIGMFERKYVIYVA